MTLEYHDLRREYPQYAATIHALNTQDPHFADLLRTYDALDQEIHLHESGVEPIADEYLEPKKLQRVHLKDELYGRLVRYSAATQPHAKA